MGGKALNLNQALSVRMEREKGGGGVWAEEKPMSVLRMQMIHSHPETMTVIVAEVVNLKVYLRPLGASQAPSEMEPQL